MNARVLLTMLLLLPLPAAAQETVFYKCTDAAGTVSIQNGTPCAPGMKQEIRRIGEVRTTAAPVRAAPPPPPPPTPQYGEFVLVSGPQMRRQAVDPAAADKPPAPPLYQCRTWKGDSYLGESAQPPPRCMPLQVVGIDGSAAGGAGSACEMKTDECTEVPEEQICAAWLRRLDEAAFRAGHSAAADLATRRAELERLQQLLAQTRCAPAPQPDTPP